MPTVRHLFSFSNVFYQINDACHDIDMVIVQLLEEVRA